MRKWLYGVAALPFLASLALAGQPGAGQPIQLTEQQMDKVTAGHDFVEVTTTDLLVVGVFVATRAPIVSPGFVVIGQPPLEVVFTPRFGG